MVRRYLSSDDLVTNFAEFKVGDKVVALEDIDDRNGLVTAGTPMVVVAVFYHKSWGNFFRDEVSEIKIRHQWSGVFYYLLECEDIRFRTDEMYLVAEDTTETERVLALEQLKKRNKLLSIPGWFLITNILLIILSIVGLVIGGSDFLGGGLYDIPLLYAFSFVLLLISVFSCVFGWYKLPLRGTRRSGFEFRGKFYPF